MLGFSPAVGEHAVDALLGADVLAQRGDVVVAEHGGIEGVAALVRRCRGVGRPSLVLDVEGVDRDGLHPAEIVVGRVDHHRGVDVVECAAADHELLAAAALLRRRAEDGEASADAPRRPWRRRGRRRVRRRR